MYFVMVYVLVVDLFPILFHLLLLRSLIQELRSTSALGVQFPSVPTSLLQLVIKFIPVYYNLLDQFPATIYSSIYVGVCNDEDRLITNMKRVQKVSRLKLCF